VSPRAGAGAAGARRRGTRAGGEAGLARAGALASRSGPRRRALVLAAGYGTRLRPLTEELPKPLLPVLGRTLLARTLDALAAAGCETVAINLHHLPDAIPAAIGERWGAMPLVYSREDPILGTLGAFAPLRSFFAGCDEALLVNGDSLCDWPLGDLLARHRRSGAAATLLLAGRPDPRPFGGGIAVDRRGRVTAIRTDRAFGEVHRRHVYAGSYVLRPELLARVPEGKPTDSMTDLFLPLLEAGEGPIAALVTWRPWHDLGTAARYLEGARDWARRAGRRDGSWTSPGAVVAPGARVAGSVLEAGAVVASGAVVTGSLLLGAVSVEPGAHVERCVLAPGTRVPAGARLAGQLVTRRRGEAGSDEPLPGLVLTPLEPR
jgi:NDP-sugar pyrophosphorylase family protein